MPDGIEFVFAASEAGPAMPPQTLEPGLEPVFVPVSRIQELDSGPPLAGHLRGLLGPGRDRYAPYLANLWHPAGRPATSSPGHQDQRDRG